MDDMDMSLWDFHISDIYYIAYKFIDFYSIAVISFMYLLHIEVVFPPVEQLKKEATLKLQSNAGCLSRVTQGSRSVIEGKWNGIPGSRRKAFEPKISLGKSNGRFQ